MSECIRANVSFECTGSAVSIWTIRRARCGGRKSFPIRCGYASSWIFWFAVARNPSSGFTDQGSSSNGTNPSHSYALDHPGTGIVPSPCRRIGYSPVHW